MTPYGIVYRENPYALQKSVEIWQKKFGVFNIPTFLKIGSISAIVLLAVNLLLGFFSEDGIFTYISSFLIMTVLVFLLIYMVTNNTYVKQMSLANTQKDLGEENSSGVLRNETASCFFLQVLIAGGRNASSVSGGNRDRRDEQDWVMGRASPEEDKQDL